MTRQTVPTVPTEATGRTARPFPTAASRVAAAEQTPRPRPWAGDWVSTHLGVTLTTTSSLVGLRLEQLVGLALRRNPRRAHLLVSTVLGKHVPTDPGLVYAAGRLLGQLTAAQVADRARTDRTSGRLLALALDGDRPALEELLARATAALPHSTPGGQFPDATGPTVAVLGFAETATALGHAVADSLHAPYLHSTRRPVAGADPMGCFQEEHSHATDHLLLPEDETPFADADVLVLVDDELSTGKTALNTIRVLQAQRHRDRYVVASLIDLRDRTDRGRTDAVAAELGARIDIVSLAAGVVNLPDDVLARGQDLVDAIAHETTQPGAAPANAHETAPDRQGSGQSPERSAHPATFTRVDPAWPADVKDGARHGFHPHERDAFEAAARAVARQVHHHLDAGSRVHVLGSEELMHAPLRIAGHLTDDHDVTYSTTTRSPVLPVTDQAYAIRAAAVFDAHDDPADGAGARYAYNVPDDLDALVVVVDVPGDTDALTAPTGLIAALSGTARTIVIVPLPSYAPARPPTEDHASPSRLPDLARPAESTHA